MCRPTISPRPSPISGRVTLRHKKVSGGKTPATGTAHINEQAGTAATNRYRGRIGSDLTGRNIVAAKAETADAAETWNATIFVALTVAAPLFATGLAGAAFAAGPHAAGSSEKGGAVHGHSNGTEQGSGLGQHRSFGSFEPAPASEATRTVDVTMKDTAFEPQRIAIQAGETVRFVVRNDGQLVHEFNVGTAAMHADHQKQMAMMVDHGMLEADKINHGMMSGGQMSGGQMMHDDPNSILLEPGQTGEVVLKFTDPTTLQFACNVPGHYEAGMVGTLNVTD